MGVAFALRGRFDDLSGEAFLGKLKEWLEGDLAAHHVWGELIVKCKLPEQQGKKPGMFVRFHPACEDIEFRVPEPRRIVISGKTSPGGPGYHIALMKVLKLLGEENHVKWSPAGKGDRSSGDDTGYFFHGDKAAVEKSMVRYLGTLSNIVQEILTKAGDGQMALSMPISHNHVGGPIRTPVGLRSLEWLARVRQDPRNGLDIFPWWDEGFTATFYLGRAVCDMWMNVRWTPEDEDQDRITRMRQVHDDLCEAYRLDPTLNFPWREWAELIDLFKIDAGKMGETVKAFAAEVPADQPRIGYRRNRVGVGLAAGWRIVIPGEMEEKWEEGSWCAWSEGRTIWFSSWSLTNEAGPQPDPDEMLSRIPDDMPDEVVEGPVEVVEYRDAPMVGRGTIRPHKSDKGEDMLNLRGFTAAPGTLALVNLYFHPHDREWAVEQWKYLRHHGGAGPEKRVYGE